MSLEQNTPEWEEMRKDKVGASDAPVIMGVSPWKTPYQLWQEKLSLKESKQTYPMKRGHDLEPLARSAFEEMTGTLVAPTVLFHPEHPWMMASLDALDIEGKVCAEIKCPGSQDHTLAQQGKIPEKYIPQLQHQLEVCQIEKGFYFSFDGKAGVLIEYYRDDKYIKKLISIEKEFYECVQELTAPKLTSRDYQEVTDKQWELLADEYLSLSQQISALEAREKLIREDLISKCQGQSCQGFGIKVLKTVRKGNVEYKNIPELKNVDLELYRKEPVHYWKIST